MEDKNTKETKPVINSDNSEKDKKRDLPNKKEEFEKFLELIGRHSVGHWVQIAKALNVNVDTITEWKKHPLAQKLIRDELDRVLEGMEKAGTKDWKMWESKAKMLGISPIEKADITSNGEKVEFGLVSYDKTKENASDPNTA